MSPITEGREVPDFEIGHRVANVPPYLRKAKDRNFHDDGVNVDKVNMKKLTLMMDGKRPVRVMRAKRTGEMLGHVSKAARAARGMQIGR